MKKPILIISIVIVVILGITLYFFNFKTKSFDGDTEKQEFISAEDILENANFSADNSSVELKKIDVDAEEIFVPIKLTDKTQQELIKAFEKSRFKKDDSVIISNDYRMKITLNRGYVMYLDMNKKGISVEDVDGSSEEYVIEDGQVFFSVLEKAVTE